jgi:hypothetical protein
MRNTFNIDFIFKTKEKLSIFLTKPPAQPGLHSSSWIKYNTCTTESHIVSMWSNVMKWEPHLVSPSLDKFVILCCPLPLNISPLWFFKSFPDALLVIYFFSCKMH